MIALFPALSRRWGVGCVLALWCLLAPARAQQYNMNGEKMFLGDAGTDQAKARAAVQEAASKRAEWELVTLAGDYSRVGVKDPRWDDDARDGLTAYARYVADAPELNRLFNSPPLRQAATGNFDRALAAKCEDPLVGYCALVLGAGPSVAPQDLPRLSAAAEGKLEKSGYSPMRKFQASLRATETAGSAATQTAAATGRPPASPPGTDMQASLDRARGHLAALIRDPGTPREVSARAVADFMRALRVLPDSMGDRACAEMAKFLDAPDWTAAAQDSAALSTAEGTFRVRYAWRGNGDFRADMIRDARWKPFVARLAKAQAALERAWRLDPTDARTAIGMLGVERGQHQGRERLETWFRRAMDADPDSFEACAEKMKYLQPRWYGDAPQMVELGHQCQATRNWAARLPFILVEAHRQLAAQEPRPADYWRRPDVWNDVRTVYADCLALGRPDADYERSGFALYACTASQWKVADDLFKELGDHPNLHAMSGLSMAQYKQLKGQAAYLAPMKPEQADALTSHDEAAQGSRGITVDGE